LSYGITIGLVCSTGIESDRGGRAANEDNYLVCRNGQIRFRDDDKEVVRAEEGAGVLLAVADGMGGHEDGALASAAAVQAFSLLFGRGKPQAPELALLRFVLKAHRRLHATVARRGSVRLGTTLTGAWILDGRVFWVHVGDSRLYFFRNNTLVRLTADHTHREFALRDQRPIPADADRLAQSFVYGSRGLGDDAGVRIDPGRDTGSRHLRPGDLLLLCTDGLTGVVDDRRIADALREVPQPAACAEVLVERAIAHGSTDNITAMVVRIDEVPAEPRAGGLRDDDTLIPDDR
jgi:serine/threonine protein phosphatase PrpC